MTEVMESKTEVHHPSKSNSTPAAANNKESKSVAADRLMSLAELMQHQEQNGSHPGTGARNVQPEEHERLPEKSMCSQNDHGGGGRGSEVNVSTTVTMQRSAACSSGNEGHGDENPAGASEPDGGSREASRGDEPTPEVRPQVSQEKAAKILRANEKQHQHQQLQTPPPGSKTDDDDEEEAAPGSPGSSRQRSYFVKHDYRDHAHVRLEELSPLESAIPVTQRSNRGGVKMLFPEKLHQLLSMSPDVIDHSIISWAPHGRCFSVHNTREFTRELMPKYFNHNAITSFQRQLNLYGFKRITKAGSKDQGAYYHELFLKGRPAMCRRMRRQKIKGTGYKPLPDPDNEPDFYSMPPCFHILDEQERKEQEELAMSLDRAANGVDSGSLLSNKRSMGSMDGLALSQQMADIASSSAAATKAMRMDLQDGDAFAARSDLLARAAATASASEAVFENVRRLSLLGSMGGGGSALNSVAGYGRPRRISLPERYGISPAGMQPGEMSRRGSLPLASGRDPMGRRFSSVGAAGGDDSATMGRVPFSGSAGGTSSPSVNGMARDSLFQELLARARGGSSSNNNDMANPLAAMSNDSALRNEIDMLEQSRRNIVLQQQRLQILMDQAHGGGSSGGGGAAGHNAATRRLSMASDYSSGAAAAGGGGNGGGGGGGGPNWAAAAAYGEMERRASLAGLERRASLVAAAGRQLANNPDPAVVAAAVRRASMGAINDHTSAMQATPSVPSGDGSATPAATVYNALANMVSSGRFTTGQLDEIELLLQSGRAQAQASEHRSSRGQYS